MDKIEKSSGNIWKDLDYTDYEVIDRLSDRLIEAELENERLKERNRFLEIKLGNRIGITVAESSKDEQLILVNKDQWQPIESFKNDNKYHLFGWYDKYDDFCCAMAVKRNKYSYVKANGDLINPTLFQYTTTPQKEK